MSTELLKTEATGVHETSRGSYICTHSGKKFYPNDIRVADIDIEDIAWALSNQCRFSGHTSEHFSVAQHSLMVSSILPEELKLQGLLHDASEAYLCDLPKPLKHLADFSAYRRIEKNAQQVIYRKYGIIYPDPPEIKKADAILLGTEARDLMGNPGWCHEIEPKLGKKIVPKTISRVRTEFLDEFHRLTDGKWK